MIAALTIGAALALSACGDSTRKAIGLDRDPPDEFSVVTRAPLALPPDFGLRPPAPGTTRPQEQETKDAARNILIQSGASSQAANDSSFSTGLSSGEKALLGRAGASSSNPSIRREVDAESAQIADAQRSFIDKLVFWRKEDPPGDVVDARKESQRLRENAALGTPPTTGATPVIVRREKGLLEGLLN